MDYNLSVVLLNFYNMDYNLLDNKFSIRVELGIILEFRRN